MGRTWEERLVAFGRRVGQIVDDPDFAKKATVIVVAAGLLGVLVYGVLGDGGDTGSVRAEPADIDEGSLDLGSDDGEEADGGPASRSRDPSCIVDVDAVEEISGMEEIIESIDCVYWAGYVRPTDNASALCEGVLRDLRLEDPDVEWLKMKTREGATVADCR